MADIPTPPGLEPFREPTSHMDADHPGVASYARDLVSSAGSDPERALRIFRATRDDIRCTPDGLTFVPNPITASRTLETGQGCCVQKAILLAATARAGGLTSRPGSPAFAITSLSGAFSKC